MRKNNKAENAQQANKEIIELSGPYTFGTCIFRFPEITFKTVLQATSDKTKFSSFPSNFRLAFL